jgi:hypothetical protein
MGSEMAGLTAVMRIAAPECSGDWTYTCRSGAVPLQAVFPVRYGHHLHIKK